MFDDEVVLVRSEMGIWYVVDVLYEGVIVSGRVGVSSFGGVFYGRKDVWRFDRFDEIVYNFVVKIFDGCLFDLFFCVFFLFGFECELNEDLL